jgi:hypothetical protein
MLLRACTRVVLVFLLLCVFLSSLVLLLWSCSSHQSVYDYKRLQLVEILVMRLILR